MSSEIASIIPAALRAELVERTGHVIAGETPRGGGGASRQGAELVLRAADGAERHCYLAWDLRAGDPSRRAYFNRETAVLAALSSRFAGAGIKVARLIATFPSHLALLTDFVPGSARFPLADDKAALARDFVTQLARLHALDAHDPAFAALGDPDQPPSARVRANLRTWRDLNLARGADPVLQLALAWLTANVPADDGRSVILHGDAGPGNFLFDDRGVTALLDWELTHLGDPVEDLAQVAVRSLIQPFVPMRDLLSAYEQATGLAVDRARIAFYRLYFQVSFSVPTAAVGATGTALLYGTMHRRVMVRSIAQQMGVALTNPALPSCPPSAEDASFATALADLKDEIAPAARTQRAAAKAKELARLVKYWRNRSTYGAAFDAAELAELRVVLPGRPADLPAARLALARAIAAGTIDLAEAVALCHARVVRETAIMAEAMGALAARWYEDETA